jgi:tRNA-uridine 2-sulfurtransferase
LPKFGKAPTWFVQVHSVRGESAGSGRTFCGYPQRVIEVFGDSSRGDELAFVRLAVDGDRIVSAEADGLERPLTGLTLLEAAAIPGETLAADALANALGQVFHAKRDPERVAVAMSGGVDSAVALLRAGPKAIGVTLRLWIDPEAPDSERACCSPEAVIAARETCHSLGLPHVTLDLREEFRSSVVESFVRGYAAGETPNPCIRCNGSFRFAELLAFARRSGAARLATGHYVRTAEHKRRRLLARAVDETKDQSYMLAGLDPALLGRLWFPLGEQTKVETREEAARAGLAVATRRESQEACFLGGADYRDFLERRGVESEEGPIVVEDGAVVGRHAGLWRYTPGQRRGLGVASAEPLYALRSEPRTNTLVVAPRGSLARREVTAEGRLYVPATLVQAKVRYRSPAAPATVEPCPGGFRLSFDEPVYAVAPGQAAVVYEDDVVVGAGTIRPA